MTDKSEAPVKIPVRVQMTGAKVHGPNSPDVIAGRVPLGHRDDPIAVGVPVMHEVDYDEAVRLWGREKADELFSGVGR